NHSTKALFPLQSSYSKVTTNCCQTGLCRCQDLFEKIELS
ncbi:4885_t:CDS:1, partial [Cetraspora pellucida]